MYATIDHAGNSGYCTIYISRGKERLEFSGALYQRAFKNGNYDPFEQINKYWSRADPAWQDELFSLFVKAKNILNEVFQVNPLILKLRPILTAIIDMHDAEGFDHWVRRHAGVWIPEDLDTEYKYSPDRPGSREQTYLVSDYWELATAVLKLRPIAPIWGEFVEITKKESGSEFRDLNTYYTISKSPIVASPAIKRLMEYINKNVKQDDINIRSSIDGIGSDVFQTNLLSNILVRWLSIASLTRDPSNTHLVQITHKELRNRLTQNDSHQNAILEKTNPNEGDESEDSSSRAEKYKNKPLVAAGVFVAIDKWVENVRAITARLLLKQDLSRDEVREVNAAVDCAFSMEEHVMEECQLHLIRWVVAPIVSPRAFWDIEKSSILRLAGISQYVLWNTGFRDLAGIATARNMSADGYGVGGSESRAHIPKELIDKINALYPYYKRHPAKKAIKPVNDAVTEIMTLSQDLAAHTWFLNMPDDHIAELRGSSANKTFRVGYDIRIRLAELVIYVQERNKNYRSLYDF